LEPQLLLELEAFDPPISIDYSIAFVWIFVPPVGKREGPNWAAWNKRLVAGEAGGEWKIGNA
jgi:hypothetical protein